MTYESSGLSSKRVIIRQPGEGRLIPGPEGLTLKATGSETGGSVGCLEATTPSGFGPPRHIHHTCDELFYVLDGEFLFLVGDRTVNAPAGSFVFVPRGTIHAPKSVGSVDGKVLVAFVPGGQEQAFEEFARLQQLSDNPSPEQVAAIAKKFESEFVGPPL